MSGAASAVNATSSPVEVKVTKETEPPPLSSSSSRGRGRTSETAEESRGSRSRSRLRKPKMTGSKLKGMVKSGWKSVKKLSSKGGSTVSSSDMASRTSTDNGSIAFTSETDCGGNSSASKAATMESLLDSKGGSFVNAATTESALELVVLIMDPISQRFELLQLEFDSWKAKVSDLLTQIPISVTEPSLKEQPFVGVLDSHGSLQEGSTRLMEAFGTDGSKTIRSTTKLVLVAKPEGMSTKETMRLAKPILTNTQVSKMLEASGFDMAGWKSVKKGAASASHRTSRSLGDDVPNKEYVSVGKEDSTTKGNNKVASNGKSNTVLLVIVAVVGICLYTVHSILTTPITVGTVVPPGTIRSKCGVMGWIPPIVKDVTKTLLEPFQSDIQTADNLWNCDNEYLHVNGEGEMKITDANGDLVVFVKGSGCTATSKKSCVKGVLLQDNKTVKIGNKVVKSGIAYYHDGTSATTVANRKLSPWPFAEEPKMKLTPSKRS
ncbi:hypothetical protein IV203_028225 [Nitzschia inconspicua]|uniref:Uncharacterized protein n=1 Tax=Nitzschia inconspicua TaxID=303405 RepID=A0A9K3PCA2_9STRA|nr:hypothetical protein IV203_028225 [Nitzschia inconspicua]